MMDRVAKLELENAEVVRLRADSQDLRAQRNQPGPDVWRG